MLKDPNFKEYKLEELMLGSIKKNPMNLDIDNLTFNQTYFEMWEKISTSRAKTKVKIIDGLYIAGLNIEHEVSTNLVTWTNGVADNYKQILDFHKDLIESQMKFVCFITPIYKKEQPSSGGWRWHKWGEYIGNYEIKNEYLYDEDIEVVYVYQFFYLDVGDLNFRVVDIDKNTYVDYNFIEDAMDATKVYKDDILLFLLEPKYAGLNKDYTFEILKENKND